GGIVLPPLAQKSPPLLKKSSIYAAFQPSKPCSQPINKRNTKEIKHERQKFPMNPLRETEIRTRRQWDAQRRNNKWSKKRKRQRRKTPPQRR
ncbi:hypothetical protein, partial [Fusicatenibacter saccharivorans]|uniref:hypothetical protein n=1 Tax=Fusicatenibacter saccharivorans TaxID=1150298 RepID=UPI0022E06658